MSVIWMGQFVAVGIKLGSARILRHEDVSKLEICGQLFLQNVWFGFFQVFVYFSLRIECFAHLHHVKQPVFPIENTAREPRNPDSRSLNGVQKNLEMYASCACRYRA